MNPCWTEPQVNCASSRKKRRVRSESQMSVRKAVPEHVAQPVSAPRALCDVLPAQQLTQQGPRLMWTLEALSEHK